MRHRNSLKTIVAGLAAGAILAAHASDITGIGVTGAPTLVFRHADPPVTPDAQVTAWRTRGGRVSLLLPGSESFRLTGPDLLHVRFDPRPIFSSTRAAGHAEENRHDYGHWLMGPYSLDGRTFYTLTHSEWYACLAATGCTPDASTTINGWTATLNSLVSHDGGSSWRLNTVRGNHVVADLAHRWTQSAALAARIDLQAMNHSGTFQPTRVLRGGRYFYSVAYFIHRDFSAIHPQRGAFEAPIDRVGYVLLRTPDIGDPNRWEGWSGGAGFASLAVAPPAVFQPSIEGVPVNGAPPQIVQDTRCRCVILFLTTFGGGNPVYFMTTRRLDRPVWSEARPVTGTALLLTNPAQGLKGFNDANYPSVIDPASPGFNFEFTSGRPQLYFVTAGRAGDASATRELYRTPLEIRYSSGGPAR